MALLLLLLLVVADWLGYVMRAFLSTSQVKSNQSDLAKKNKCDRTTPRAHTHISKRAELIV